MDFDRLLKLYDGGESLRRVYGIGERVLAGMDGIEYGYINKDGERVFNIDEREFWKGYRLQSPDELRVSRLGVCWDQVEMEREVFEKMEIGCASVYVELESGNSHTFCVYREGDKWVWVEHSYGRVAGVHRGYNKIEDIVDEVVGYMVEDKVKEGEEEGNEIKFSGVYDKPEYGINCGEFMEWCKKGKVISEKKEDDVLYRVTIDGVGVYEWVRGNISNEEWRGLLKDEGITWLRKPDYDEGYESWFTALGYGRYLERVVPLIFGWIEGEDVEVEEFEREGVDVVYEDEDQVVGVRVYVEPWGIDRLKEEGLWDGLKGDEVHVWRARTGVELVHEEPDLKEFERVVKNWKLMDDEMKERSDKKSRELFGKGNMERVEELRKLYKGKEELQEEKYVEFNRPRGVIGSLYNFGVIENVYKEEKKEGVKCVCSYCKVSKEYGKDYKDVVMGICPDCSDRIKNMGRVDVIDGYRNVGTPGIGVNKRENWS
jgi:hypothetical protein